MVTVKKTLKVLFWIVIIGIAIYSIIIIFQKIVYKNKIPNFFGYKNFIVLTGSMKPTLNVGDIVFVKETTDIKAQDIISFREQNEIITHRVVGIKRENDKDYYITKGDANSGNDTELVSIEDVEGKYSFKILWIGNVILFLQKPVVLIISFLILLVVLVIGAKKSKRNPRHLKGK